VAQCGVLDMDWHSSAITTSVMGALKRGLNDRANKLGLYVCGGRGRRNSPGELRAVEPERAIGRALRDCTVFDDRQMPLF
jgi:hypothetical protein